MFPQRHARFLCLQIPTRSLDRRLGHAMTTHRSYQTKNVFGALNLVAQRHWRQKLRERRPARVSLFVAIKRSFTRRALSPSLCAVRIRNAREEDAAFGSATETGFEEVDERQANFAQINRRD